MADDRIGMTAAQKFLTFVPLAAVCVYVALIGIGKVAVRVRTEVVTLPPITVYTAPVSGYNDCSAKPTVTEVGEGDSVTFSSLEGGQYTIAFNNVRSPFAENPPYVSNNATPYHINTGTRGHYYGYSVSNGTCSSPPELIGIIVTH
jgi:hypothetical protein